jgi:hypothetical protein
MRDCSRVRQDFWRACGVDPGHDSLAAAARAFYAGLRIIDRSSTPLAPTDIGHEFIEALQILQAALEQTTAHQHPEVEHNEAGARLGRVRNPSAADATSAAIW